MMSICTGPSSYFKTVSLLVLVLFWVPISVYAQAGSVSFAQDRILVEEGPSSFTTVVIPLERVGGTAGAIVISITVSDY